MLMGNIQIKIHQYIIQRDIVNPVEIQQLLKDDLFGDVPLNIVNAALHSVRQEVKND